MFWGWVLQGYLAGLFAGFSGDALQRLGTLVILGGTRWALPGYQVGTGGVLRGCLAGLSAGFHGV